MTLAPEIVEKLRKPLDPSRVKHREGSGGRSLSYLEGHDVIRAANDVFGIGNWSYNVVDLTALGEEPVERYDKKGFRVAYRATVHAQVNGVGYSDVGYGDAQEYTGSRLTPHELASKEAVTDALKRALKNFGDQFGLCLYDKFAPEHNGAAQTPAANGGGSGLGATGSGGGAAVPPPATQDAGWSWPSGKNQGRTLAETDRSYIEWYAEKGPKPDVRERCNAFLLDREFAEVGATEVRDGYTDPEDLPF